MTTSFPSLGPRTCSLSLRAQELFSWWIRMARRSPDSLPMALEMEPPPHDRTSSRRADSMDEFKYTRLATLKSRRLVRSPWERAGSSACGGVLTAAGSPPLSGRHLFILKPNGEIAATFSNHQTSVSDFSWNPKNPLEIASVCGGGARMWRIGETEPFARFDWGGASLLVLWSPTGRWLVTGRPDTERASLRLQARLSAAHPRL